MLLHLQEEIHVRRNVGALPSGVLELAHLRQAPRRGDLVPRRETRYADVHRVMPPGLATGQDVTVRWLRHTRGKPKPRHVEHDRVIEAEDAALAVQCRGVRLKAHWRQR